MYKRQVQDKSLRDFDRIAREHGVRYTVFKTEKGHYPVSYTHLAHIVEGHILYDRKRRKKH